MSEVVGINSGATIAHPGAPDPELVARLERLLQMAKAGEINGIAYAGLCWDGSTIYNTYGRMAPALLGGIELARHICTKALAES